MSDLVGQGNILSDPAKIDEDGDQVMDVGDNCLGIPNPTQADENQDDIGTACQCGDVDWNGFLDENDVAILQGCADDPQTCQYPADRGDADGDGSITQTDVDRLQETVDDPEGEPPQNLLCSLRPRGESPRRPVPEPRIAEALALALGLLLAISRRRTRRSVS
jgi:hypothetical protein